MAETVPVILDTDIGSDIDDAAALAYLLRQPRCELLGITTVSGDVARRAACAEVVCRAGGREDVPIHCGASGVLLHGPGQPTVPQYEAIASLPHRNDRPANTAVDFLRRTIRSRPGEITLLSIGPLTNLALLFALDPDCRTMLKRVVSMVGKFFEGPENKEWNAGIDPVATAMLYRHCHSHLSISVDVTRQCTMPADSVRQRFTGPLLEVVRQMAEVWFRSHEKLCFHDPLAASVLFRPQICQYTDGQVEVLISNDEEESGKTRFHGAAGGGHRIAHAVDTEAFFQEYFSVFE